MPNTPAVPGQNPPQSGQQPAVSKQVLMQLQAYAGPIPPPALLEEYDRIQPGAADRILTQFEEQGRHRRKIENRVVSSNIFSSILGQVMAYSLFVGSIALGGFLIWHDKPVGGIAAIITAMGGAAWVLRKSEAERKRELAEKRDREKRR